MRALEIAAFHRGVVRTSRYRPLRNQWTALVREGRMIRALPGVLIDIALVDDWRTWLRAAHLWNPNIVVCGAAAAALTFAPDTDVNTVQIYSPTQITDRGPLGFERRQINWELVTSRFGLRVTIPEATALTAGLLDDYGPATQALRTRTISTASLAAAAAQFSGRPQAKLRAVVRDLRANPWSVAEIAAHRLLRDAGITGWTGNPAITINGRVLHPDVAFERSKVALEIDSYEHHSSPADMEHDAARRNLFLAAGWRSYSLTPRQVRDDPAASVHFLRTILPQRHLSGASASAWLG